MNAPPNLLLLVSDQQRADLLGCAGRIPVLTPHLDRLASEGTHFVRAYTPCPLCTPARATLVTGQYPSRHGAWSIGTDLAPDCLSLPAQLGRLANYRTGLIGKSHLVSCLREGSLEALPLSRDRQRYPGWSGPWYGFEHARLAVGHAHEPHAHSLHYGAWLERHGIPPAPPYFALAGGGAPNDEVGRWALPESLHSGAWIVEETGRFLAEHAERHKGRPFFLSVNFPDPHLPFRVPAPWDEMYADTPLPAPVRRAGEDRDKPTLFRATVRGAQDSLGWHLHAGLPSQTRTHCEFGQVPWSEEELRRWRIYLAMQSLLDKQVGQILAQLSDYGFGRDTLVVYTSDHGDLMGDHWLCHKGGSHYRAAVNVPLLVRWPDLIPAGQVSEELQSLVDLPATFVAAAGLAPVAGMQGQDQLACWRGQAPSPRPGVWIDHRVEEGLSVNTWITRRHRLSVHSIHAEARDEFELYDLVEDPDEFVNLSSHPQQAATALALMGELQRYQQRVSAPWQPRLAFA